LDRSKNNKIKYIEAKEIRKRYTSHSLEAFEKYIDFIGNDQTKNIASASNSDHLCFT
jgi:hypothetical protein